MNICRIVQDLKRDEGFSSRPYWDKDQWTWGYGTKAPGPDGTITKAEAEIELLKYLNQTVKEYDILFGNVPQHINEVRQEALIQMLYNLGMSKMMKFRRMIAQMKDNEPDDWAEVAAEAMDSVWYRTNPGGPRPRRIVRELLTGEKVE
jgi:GH24 family phage-related lysozyme (muramidase)